MKCGECLQIDSQRKTTGMIISSCYSLTMCSEFFEKELSGTARQHFPALHSSQNLIYADIEAWSVSYQLPDRQTVRAIVWLLNEISVCI